MHQTDMFRNKAEIRRDEGKRIVLEHAGPIWQRQYQLIVNTWLESLPENSRFNGESPRIRAITCGLCEPHNPNVWGAAFSSVIRPWLECGIIVRLGETEKAVMTQANARAVSVYRKLRMGNP